ncbi:MAG: TonB family protein [Bdellovibrionales bacterium]|nr:TonB family protein [Bdellovibrionales bacterium]
MDNMKSYQPLIISLLAHICLILLALLAPSESLLKPQTQDIEVVYQNETKPKLFVSDPNEQAINTAIEKLKDAANKLSRYNERVKEEVAAQKSGRTQNRPPQLRKQVREELKRPLNEDVPSINRPPPNRVASDTRTGDSSLSEFIPEVKMGGFTALNTDQFIHYTFYARTNEQIRNRWTSNIKNFLNNTVQTELNRLAQQTQISQIEIILDPNGRFIKALIHQRSQNPDIDQAAIEAFRQASPLNNPPEEMIESDGFIHLHYGFHIQLRPRYLARGSK